MIVNVTVSKHLSGPPMVALRPRSWSADVMKIPAKEKSRNPSFYLLTISLELQVLALSQRGEKNLVTFFPFLTDRPTAEKIAS